MEIRYEDPGMCQIFSDQAKIDRWYNETVRSMQMRGVEEPRVQGAADRAALRHPPSALDVQERESLTGHDVAAYLWVVDQRAGADDAFRENLHYGLTSSDLVDNAHHEALLLATTRLMTLSTELRIVLWDLVDRHDRTYMLGRTHGQIAEPTTFGHRMHLFHTMVQTSGRNLRDMQRALMVRKTPGAVGTSGIYNSRRDSWAVTSSQIIPRDLQAHWAFHFVEAINACEAIAMEIRLLSGQGIQEVEEGGADRRTGSSAMPHKRNPILAENICGLARMGRGYLAPILETVVTFHDRDISNSSVERVAVPDLAHIAATCVKRTARLLRDLKVNENTMHSNLSHAGDRPYSSLAVSILQESGYPYVESHELVSEAFRDWTPLGKLRDLMNALNYDTITFDRKWEERANPAWMTRNIRRRA